MIPFRPYLLAALFFAAPQAPSTNSAPQPAGGPPLPWATVSIHAVDPSKASDFSSHDQPNGISEHSMLLKDIISEGYHFSVMPFRDDQITGLPEWAKTTRYDVEARVDPESVGAFKKLSNLSMHDTIAAFNSKQPTGEMLMMQSLLAERFHLRCHWESKDRSVYVVNIAKGGLRMKPAVDTFHGEMSFDRGHLAGKGVPIAFLASLFEIPTERTVVDGTGDTGAYDFDLRFDPHDSTSNNQSNDPDFFTAVQEQLGLKLQNSHAAVPVLVVDHIDPPTPN